MNVRVIFRSSIVVWIITNIRVKPLSSPSPFLWIKFIAGVHCLYLHSHVPMLLRRVYLDQDMKRCNRSNMNMDHPHYLSFRHLEQVFFYFRTSVKLQFNVNTMAWYLSSHRKH
jgi:hypothetical protein